MEYDEKDGMGDRHKILTDLYYNPEIGYQSKNKLYRKAKPYFLQNGMTLTMKNVDDFIKRQETAQVNKQKTRKTAYNKITSHGVNDIWQADLLDVQKWSKFNQGYRYILTIIDIYSRFAWVIPLKTKTTDEVREALEELLRTYNLTNFTTDNGKEFTGNEVKNY
jgi:transposase InsO family protein